MVGSPGQRTGASPLLGTKLYIPKQRATLVPRPRLVQRLDRGAEHPLTLISTAAGFGKTTLLAEWVGETAAGERPAPWLSLDQGDNNLERFWVYVVTALRGLRPDVGESALSLLRSPQPPPSEWVLTALINDITAISDGPAAGSGHGLTLILVDYHLIEAEPVHRSVAFLLEHLPPQLHLVIATRSDPPLPLARLRARDELAELRATDLRLAPGMPWRPPATGRQKQEARSFLIRVAKQTTMWLASVPDRRVIHAPTLGRASRPCLTNPGNYT